MMEGTIVKGIAGFYYVHVEGLGLYACRAKGIFRNKKQKPLVGDRVLIDILHEEDKEGNIRQIFPRKSQLIRPSVANIDQVLIVFALAQPEPNLNLMDRFLVGMERQQVETVICFNKSDLVSEKRAGEIVDIYSGCGAKTVVLSVRRQEGIEEVRALLRGRATAFAGPSGAGKSSLFNSLSPDFKMETGEVSAKIKRGRHTTRHTELIPLGGQTYIMDTPGFSSFYIDGLEKEELKDYFYEFTPYEPYCRFQGCQHMDEPVCGVKDAVSEGKISKSRYNNYRILYEELKGKKKW